MAASSSERKPLPGSVGWPLIGDKSVDFYRDPVKFVEKNCDQYNNQIFSCRFLNVPTVFVCSNDGVREVLADRENALELGYHQFMGKIFGHNILFTEGDEAFMFRDQLSNLFTSEAVSSYQVIVKRIAEKHVNKINPSEPLCLYEFFKQVMTEICLTLFLGLNFDTQRDEATNVVALTVKHWHGIISVPVKLKIPGTNNENAFSSALMSKKSLLRVIAAQRSKSQEGFVQSMQEGLSGGQASAREEEFVNNHMLLFTSALVPKALSSLLTSFAIQLAQPTGASMHDAVLTDEKLRSCMYREVERMYPPFLGGRRIVKKDCTIGGYHVPAGHAIVFMTGAAHRDPATFIEPDTFNHRRWSSDSGNPGEKLFTLGYGPRRCIGQQLVWNIIDEVAVQLMRRYQWQLRDKQDFTHKLLPVSRPKGAVLVTLTPVTPSPAHRPGPHGEVGAKEGKESSAASPPSSASPGPHREVGIKESHAASSPSSPPITDVSSCVSLHNDKANSSSASIPML